MPDLVVLFLTIPVITSFVGWVTNWAAVKMIFHPENFIGIGRIWWQAILVRRSHKFADGAAERLTPWQTSLWFEDTAVSPGATYTYSVRAAENNQGANASIFSASPPLPTIEVVAPSSEPSSDCLPASLGPTPRSSCTEILAMPCTSRLLTAQGVVEDVDGLGSRVARPPGQGDTARGSRVCEGAYSQGVFAVGRLLCLRGFGQVVPFIL